MIKRRLFLMITVSVFLCLPIAVQAETKRIELTDDIQMTLGNSFFTEGDYYRAITEYKRLVFLFPQSERLPEALYQIGMAYYHGEDYASAANSFANVRQTYAAPFFSDAAFYEGLSYGKLGRHDDAALAFKRSRLFDETHPTAANAQLGLSLNSIAQDKISTCRDELSDFLISYPEDERIPAVRGAFTLLDEYESKPRKSPLLAGTLSTLLPGSGQVYAEHYKDGMMAFIVNSLFIVRDDRCDR